MKLQVGIEAIAVALPRRYVDIEELARARGVDPAKYTQGLGAREMAVPDPGEDAVALAASAASRLLRQTRLDPARLGMLVVGTETGVDHSKPVASYVQGLLGLPRTIRTYDTQHACYGGTAALMTGCEWIASGTAAGRRALVIATDVARYGLHTAGEPTQGGGAVALLVSDEPKVLAIDLGLSGVSSAHVFDFWRPHGQREALVDGHYSIDCYLESLAGAYRGWRDQALARGEVTRGDTGALPSEQLARILYHVPFCKMARKAHTQVRACDLEDATPADDRESVSRSSASFELQVAPSLWLNAQVGNAYTASLYLALAGLLHQQATQLAGKRIGLFSYGSGCVSEFFSGVVGSNAAEEIARAELEKQLAQREKVSIAEYERLMNLAANTPEPLAPPPGGYRLKEIREHRRMYEAG